MRFLVHMPARPPKRLQNRETFLSELRQIIASELKDENGDVIKESGKFPTRSQLRKSGNFNICIAIDFHGSATKLREEMGFSLAKKSTGYWDNWDNIALELISYVENLGRFPKKT